MNTCNLQSLMEPKNKKPLDFTLKGLIKGHVGMLIAAPNVGKSHLSLCIAMEHASTMQILGISAQKQPQKTLVLSSEDSLDVIQSRMTDKLKNCTQKIKKELNENLHFLTDIDPIVVPPTQSAIEQVDHRKYLSELIEIFKQFNLVIIDTVTEAIGECEEVKHDRHIKNVIQHLAKESGASILLVHHVNKEEIRGNQEITMASGAGLTSIMRLTKCLFTLKRQNNKLCIAYLKSNYFSENEQREFFVEVKNGLTVNPDVYSSRTKAAKRDFSLDEPEHITVAGVVEDEETKENRKKLRDVL
ncbi:hypothetical protein CTH30272_03073 [Allocatenococcus thiocycli]|nr:hypothetical protein CTH30272_03073 [Catenococcus thiocycli]